LIIYSCWVPFGWERTRGVKGKIGEKTYFRVLALRGGGSRVERECKFLRPT